MCKFLTFFVLGDQHLVACDGREGGRDVCVYVLVIKAGRTDGRVYGQGSGIGCAYGMACHLHAACMSICLSVCVCVGVYFKMETPVAKARRASNLWNKG